MIANQAEYIPPVHLPFFLINCFKQSHSLAKTVARQRKNTYSKVVEVASSRV